jgi:hypothetical protein
MVVVVEGGAVVDVVAPPCWSPGTGTDVHVVVASAEVEVVDDGELVAPLMPAPAGVAVHGGATIVV